jgi:hypothetical protein
VSLTVYKLLHLVGVVFLFSALGALLAGSWPGTAGATDTWRKRSGITHGLALLVVLVSGFGMLARLGGGSWGLWVWLKVATWLALGASLVLVRRQPRLVPILWFVLPLLGGFAAYLALYKPV